VAEIKEIKGCLDFYSFLGLDNFAPLEEVKKKYRQLVLVYHPDRGGDEEKMKRLNHIYDILLKAKEGYDNWLRQQLAPNFEINYDWIREQIQRSYAQQQQVYEQATANARRAYWMRTYGSI